MEKELIAKNLEMAPNKDKSTNIEGVDKSLFIDKMCIVRTYSAGVYCGIVKEISGQEALMEEARIIYRWEGAFTLLEMANKGITGGKISEPVKKIYLSQIVNTIIMTDAAINSFRKIKPYQI